MRILRLVLLGAFAAACGDATSSEPLSGANRLAGIPEGWGGTTAAIYDVGLDKGARHGGSASLYIVGPSGPTQTQSAAILTQGFRPDPYRGKRVRFSAWARGESLSGAYAGLWLRVDGPGLTLGFDNMSGRPLTGSSDWHQISVVLDVGPNALGIIGGVLKSGSGTLLVDDMKFEIVGTDVPSTNLNTGPVPSSVDSASTAVSYARAPLAPVNLDFEGLPAVSQETIAWLGGKLSTLTTTDPQASLDDLAPLKTMVGSARLIGLGEDTHGTSEFFRMKHRMLEFFVKQMGATYFAIEATSPESDDMNQYVLNGVGDPRRWLSRLYFWTWNTQEVLDMVQWMHDWNLTAPANQRVQFLGFDMQSPGAAMDSVATFIARVDATQAAAVTSAYACLSAYRNRAQLSGSSWNGYAGLPAATKAACAAGLQSAFDLLNSRRATYEVASSPAIYQQVLHDARMVQQFETMISSYGSSASGQSRDRSMAENIGWIREHAPANARIVLWAHNGHINSVPQTMGSYLRANYGADYVNLGFAFGHGSFNAVGANGPLQAWTAALVPSNSIEAVFAGTGKQLALFDTRTIPSGGVAAQTLSGPIPMRSIGAVFDKNSEAAYFGSALLPSDFDMLLYVGTTTASKLLPFTY